VLLVSPFGFGCAALCRFVAIHVSPILRT